MKKEGHSSPIVSLDTGLTVLARFESKHVAFAPADVERLTAWVRDRRSLPDNAHPAWLPGARP
jgi:hypothetical protein